MPLLRLVCPHCESNIEVQVTSVTRTRACSQCGRPIVLQFSTEVTGRSKRSLLLDVQEVVEVAVEPRPQVLSSEQNLQARMKLDPEVAASARQLRMGLLVVLLLIGLLVAGHFLNWWSWTQKGEDGLTDQSLAASKVAEKQDDGNAVPSTSVSMKKEPVSTGKSGELILSGKPNTDEAMRIAKAFLEAANVDERLKYVRDKELMTEKIRQYYEKHPDGPIAYEQITAEPSNEDGPRFVFRVVLPGGEIRELQGGMRSNGETSFDWASFVVYHEMDWTDFMNEKPTQAVLFRVLAARDERFDGEFSNSTSLGCVKLIDPLSKGAKPIYAYYEKFNSVGREMEFVMLQAAGGELPLTLTLRYPVGASSDDQVWIEERVAEGWLAKGR